MDRAQPLAPARRRARRASRAYEELLAAEPGARRPSEPEIVIPPPPRLGDKVIEAEELRKGYGNRLLIDDLSFKLPPGGIVGVIGPNGAGKTTLFRMITGQEQPDAGTLRDRRHGAASATSTSTATPRRQEDRLAGNLRRR